MATTLASLTENSTGRLNDSLSNITARRPPSENPTTKALTTAYEVLSVGLIVIVMLAIGCTMTWESVKKHLKRPTGVAVGFLCQFIILPPIGFGLAHALQLPIYQAIGVILVCSCPGGSVSNMITFWVGGDVSLSVIMTAGSTILATGMMPLNLFIYTRSWTSTSAVIPFLNILITLVSLLIPVVVGMIIRWKLPKVAKVAEMVINILGLITIAVLIILLSILYPFVYLSSWQMYTAATIIPVIGFFSGFIISKMFCMSYRYARTAAIETGCQQVALCLALIILTFKKDQRVLAEIIRFPLLFGIASFVEGAIVAFIYKMVKCCCLPDDAPEEDAKEGGGGGDAEKAAMDNEAYKSNTRDEETSRF